MVRMSHITTPALAPTVDVSVVPGDVARPRRSTANCPLSASSFQAHGEAAMHALDRGGGPVGECHGTPGVSAC